MGDGNNNNSGYRQNFNHSRPLSLAQIAANVCAAIGSFFTLLVIFSALLLSLRLYVDYFYNLHRYVINSLIL